MTLHSQLTLMSWNVENLFLIPEKISESEQLPSNFGEWIKPHKKVKALADTIARYDVDIAFLQEVGGRSSLESFCHRYLEDRYIPFHLPGNSERGIEIAYLIKKKSAISATIHSHANFALDLSHITHPNIHYRPLFERNVLELRIDLYGKKTSLFGVHLKSGQDPTGKDSGGKLKRFAEAKGLVQIVREHLKNDGGEYILLGDFNGVAMPELCEPELAPIYQLPEIQELLSFLSIPRQKRATFLHSIQRELQLDYIFLSQKLTTLIDREHSGIVYVRDIGGGPFRWPMSTAFKQGLPSDHLPLLCTFKI